MDGPVFQSLQRRDFFFSKVQTRSGAHPASNGHRGSLPEVKKPGCDVDHSPPHRAEAKKSGAMPLLPHTPSLRGQGFHHFRAYFYRDADKSLARPGRKQPTATEDFEFHISYL